MKMIFNRHMYDILKLGLMNRINGIIMIDLQQTKDIIGHNWISGIGY